MTEHDDIAAGMVFVGIEEAPELGPNTEDGEEIRRDAQGVEVDGRSIVPGEIYAPLLVAGEIGEGVGFTSEFDDIGSGVIGIL
jgi:hypothetical protein